MDFTIDKDADISIIMAAALRYSLGRSSYFVHTVQEFLRRHKENEFIKRDTQLYIEAIQSHLFENDVIKKRKKLISTVLFTAKQAALK